MKRKIFLIIITILFIVVFLGYLALVSNNNIGKYTLNLITDEDIIINFIRGEDILKEINSKKNIKQIYSVLKELNTNKESYYDNPLNPEELYQMNIKGRRKEIIIYFYKKENKYYIEQPYNGIYKINEEKYNFLKDYINEV
ncbi:MAG: DUF5301 domain-containing protein [Mollicutes bacterium]|nr:DUF5301 domain-containing protein [Mollicutes bacterium]